MAYTNSSLVTYTKLSPNHSGQRTHEIDRISPHCVVGQLSAESICGCFTSTSRQASCNYGIGYDGRISLCVEEKNRSWCTSSNANDQRAVTIEVASDSTHPYAFKDAAYAALVKLCVDICKRNGKKKLLWLADKTKTLNYTPAADEMVLTVHRWFANKSCVPTDTEVLTRSGWVKLHDINIGDEIACASLDGLRISFEEVLDKVEERRQDTYTSNGLTATKDHRMVYSVQQSKEQFRIDYYKRLLREKAQIYIPMAGYANNDGLPITDSMLMFLVAVQADGSYMYECRKDGGKSYYGVEFHLKKERKIERLKDCLDDCHLVYNETIQSDGSVKIRIYNKEGVNIVEDICEKWLNNKCFGWEWLNLSEQQAQFVLNEILLWDGCVAANLYTSRNEVNLDVISALAAINGVGSNVTGSNIQFRQNPYMTLGEEKRNNHQGAQTWVSCVTVKTGIFLCRQNGKTFIIGNCPGDWMYARMGDLASKVTAALGGQTVSGLSQGDSGDAVKTMQRMLIACGYSCGSTGADGDFGANTLAALQSFQKAAGLTVDGVYGNASKAALEKAYSTKTATGGTKDEAKTIWDTLYAEIKNAYGVAGLMGNLYAESALHANNLQNNGNTKLGMTDEQFTAAYDSGAYAMDTFIHDGYGYGLAQWTYYSRKEALAKFAKEKGTSIGDLSMQLAFLLKEIKGYTSVWKILTTATTVRAASDAVLLNFERPADQSEAVQKKRAAYGQTYYEKYATASVPATTKYYRVRKSWKDASSQIGAFTVLQNAKNCVDANLGYAVFDDSGNQVYPTATQTSFTPYLVKVSISDLNYRKGPGTSYASYGFINPGVYTIVDEQDGWGLLKAYSEKRNGWIKLSYTTKL